MSVMTPEEFERMCAWLQSPDALHFRADPDQHDDPEGVLWDCDGTHRYTRQWLRAHRIDVDANLALLRELGGCCCDCEILFNVAAPARWPGQTPLLDEPALDDVPDQVDDLARDDDALVTWLTGPEFAPAPPFLRNQRELHFRIALLNEDAGLRRDLLQKLQRMECTVTTTEAMTITGYLEYNPRYRQDGEATARLHKLLNRWQHKGHLTWSASRKK